MATMMTTMATSTATTTPATATVNAADELLLCDESVTLATPRKEEVTPRRTKPTMTIATSPVTPSMADVFDVCPWDAMEMRLVREASGDYACNANYLADVQVHGMDATWRLKMCRWMFETAKAFELTPDSVGCAIHFMDQYLSAHSVDKILLQLLCMVCMFISSKMHESQPITMEEMELLCEHKFTRDQILSVESTVLQVLNWKLTPPVAFTFARDFMALVDTPEERSEESEATVMALVQAACEEYASIAYSSSVLGVAAVRLVAQAQMVPGLDAAVTKALVQLQLPRRALVDCHAFLRRIYRAKFAPAHDLGDLADAGAESAEDPLEQSPLQPPQPQGHPRIDSPTSVEDYFEPRHTKTSPSLQRLIAAVDASEASVAVESPSSQKRTRHH